MSVTGRAAGETTMLCGVRRRQRALLCPRRELATTLKLETPASFPCSCQASDARERKDETRENTHVSAERTA